MQERGAEVGERERLGGVSAHGNTRGGNDAVRPGGRVEIGDEVEDEKALGELLDRRGGVRGGDESRSALQAPNEGAKRRVVVAPGTESGEENLHRTLLRGGERSKVLGEEGEEGKRPLLNIDAREKELEHVISHKANEERGEELTEGALESSVRRSGLTEGEKRGVGLAAISLEAKAPTRELSGGKGEGKHTHWLTLLPFCGRRFRGLRRTAG